MDYRKFAVYAQEVHADLKVERYREILTGIKGDELRWFQANRPWLVEDWMFHNVRSVSDPVVRVGSISNPVTRIAMESGDNLSQATEFKSYEAQIFITDWEVSELMRISTNDFREQMIIEKRNEHIDLILRSAVFGTKINRSSQDEYASLPRMMMSGFIEQKGRLPTPVDPVEMVYLAGNGITRWLDLRTWEDQYSGHTKYRILSECCLIAK